MERPTTHAGEQHARWKEIEDRIRRRGKALEALPHIPALQAVPFLLVPAIYLCAARAAAAATWPGAGAWVALGGLFYMWLGIYGHDCTHDAYSHHKLRNRLMGTWILAHAFASFEAYRALHLSHHQHTGFDDDPSGDSPAIQDGANLVTHFLFVLLPLGFPLFQVVPGWLAALGIEPRPYPQVVRRRIRQDFLFVVTMHAGLVALLGWRGWAFYHLVFLTGTFFILQLLGFNHVFTEVYTDCCLLNTRNIGSGPWMQLFTLNAGFHVEHHILPKVPWYRLPAVHRILMEEAGGAPYSIDGFLAAHWSVLKAHLADAFGLGRGAAI